MPKLPVFDTKEREEIRARLEDYMERHQIRVKKLFERMQLALDMRDWYYLDLRSLQRFIANDVRTDDEKVLRYQKFLNFVVPPNKHEELGAILDKMLILPVAAGVEKDGHVVAVPFDEFYGRKPIESYVGRYVFESYPYGPEHTRCTGSPAHTVHYVLLPAADERFLTIFILVEDPELDDDPVLSGFRVVAGGSLFMRFGFTEFLMIQAGGSGGRFTLLSDVTDTGDDSVTTLEGHAISNVVPGQDREEDRVQLIRLTRLPEKV